MSAKHPPVSIALPVYNGANYLREALDSISSQTFTDFEVIISDNASTDETLDICRQYAQRDHRIKVSRSEKFLHQAQNVNRAIGMCTAEWVKLFCHDDLMVPQCMARISECAAECPSRVGLIGNGEQWLFANGYRHPASVVGSSEPQYWEGRHYLREQLAGAPVPPIPSLTTATVRKSAWTAEGGFESRFVHFDAFLWTRLLMNWNYTYTPEVLTTNRIHGAQVAVSARTSLRSVADNRVFWHEFVREYGDALGLGRVKRLKVRCRGLGSAGAAVAVQMLRRDFATAVEIFVRMPVAWWPILPVFVLRSYRKERQKVAPLLPNVSLDRVYPR
jgi:glycosyltransferase involved in cell wall biosynthesis